MPQLALGMLTLYFALAFGLRSLLHWLRTGTTGFVGLSGRPAEWVGGVLFATALACAIAAPVAELIGAVAPWAALSTPAVHWIGALVCLGGMGCTLWSQLAMGDSWRIGVDESARTALVARGPFRWVRNPIFTSMLLDLGGAALLTPNWLAAAGVAALLVALELQVRRVEEPYLLRVHGPAYRAYAARTGRFLPGIGRLAA
ncbi:MAG TPA: isoprenylcysteine carboxylmethyltransferase family protein [Candidatus Limnocylindria bacterium]|nr:isoprenylcysteine carboxylmethyltransferase family protein [Candidatus Limnocylindria bacterium]